MADQDQQSSFDYDAHKRPIVGAENFLNGHHILSDQISAAGINLICQTLASVLEHKVEGDIVEFGCYVGTTSLFLRRQLDSFHESERRRLHVYDSFEGLPPKMKQDTSTVGESFTAGELAVHKSELIEQFRKAHLQLPVIHKAWFSDLQSTDMPGKIALAFLDGDFYRSIIDSLRLVWPRMATAGVILVDDYQSDALPGVERAVDDFFQTKSITLRREHQIAIIKAA